jgi:hypothetical protein
MVGSQICDWRARSPMGYRRHRSQSPSEQWYSRHLRRQRSYSRSRSRSPARNGTRSVTRSVPAEAPTASGAPDTIPTVESSLTHELAKILASGMNPSLAREMWNVANYRFEDPNFILEPPKIVDTLLLKMGGNFSNLRAAVGVLRSYQFKMSDFIKPIIEIRGC